MIKKSIKLSGLQSRVINQSTKLSRLQSRKIIKLNWEHDQLDSLITLLLFTGINCIVWNCIYIIKNYLVNWIHYYEWNYLPYNSLLTETVRVPDSILNQSKGCVGGKSKYEYYTLGCTDKKLSVSRTKFLGLLNISYNSFLALNWIDFFFIFSVCLNHC